MKDHGFSAREAIGWIRICRGGSIIGPQQLYLVSYEEELQILKREEEEKEKELDYQKRRENLFKFDVHEPEPEPKEYQTNLNSNSMMPLPAPPPPPKSARVLFVPFKGCPIKNDDDDDDTGYNFSRKTSYSRNRKRNSKPKSNFGGRGESSQQSAAKIMKRDQRFFGMNALPINMIHPQPRKVAQKKPYWKTIGSFS